jgi:mono/diheme cytochrome c family protein
MRAVVGVVAVVLAAAPALAADGPAVWKAQCAKCHGETGMADTPVSASLKVPALAGNAKIADASVDDIMKAMKANPKHSVVKGSDEEIQAAAAHAKSLAAKK